MRTNITTAATVLVVLLALLAGGCKNPDKGTDPVEPPPVGTGGTGDEMDPGIPEPFAFVFGRIWDIGIEGDGDFTIATAESGFHLFTPYGVWKRLLTPAWVVGIATNNYSKLDTGRGATVVSVDMRDCTPAHVFDDLYVQGGVPHKLYDLNWWAGNADPYYPLDCFTDASSSAFEACVCVDLGGPEPIAYHPTELMAYQKVFAPNCIADDTCEWPFGNEVPAGGYGILAYHPDAPYVPDYQLRLHQGSFDFLVYYDYPTYAQVQFLASMVYLVVPACTQHNLPIIWDITNPPPLGNYMTDRSGCTVDNVCDFDFDLLNRLVWVVPGGDSIAITEPVVFGQAIVVQQIIGGRQNGMGTLPGEFQQPLALCIDPRNQNILVSDSGNGRVQIFDNDGNFIREFGGADTRFVPGAIRVDAFGTIYVANIAPNRLEGDDLRIYSEYGSPIIYGTIEGWVKDKATQLPIDNARVHVHSTFMPLDEVTGSDGHFIFPAVAAGTHNLVAEKYGYNGGDVQASVTGGYKTVVDIYLERTMTEPPGYGQVTGTVFSTLFQEPIPDLTAEVVGEPVSGTTNGNGEFTLYSVPEGEHIFRLTAGGTIYYERYITVTKGGILDLGTIYLPIPIP